MGEKIFYTGSCKTPISCHLTHNNTEHTILTSLVHIHCAVQTQEQTKGDLLNQGKSAQPDENILNYFVCNMMIRYMKLLNEKKQSLSNF